MDRLFTTGLVTFLLTPGLSAWGQEQVTMSFSDATRPGRLIVDLMGGDIRVTGYEGSEVVIEGRGVEALDPDPSDVPVRAQGLRRVAGSQPALTVEEADNTIAIHVMSPFHRLSNLDIRVPYNTSLDLMTMTGSIEVIETFGEIEIESLNGNVRLDDVSGAALVEGLHGDVVATFASVDPAMPMSFSALSGDIDLTLPSTVAVSLRMKSTSGDIYTNFDFEAASSTERVEESNEDRQRVHLDQALVGNVNGGGPEIQLTTFHGNIYVRRGD
jgi:lia operon protein LiaG